MRILETAQLKGYILTMKLVWSSLSEEKKEDIRCKMQNLIEELFWGSNTDMSVLVEVQSFHNWMLSH